MSFCIQDGPDGMYLLEVKIAGLPKMANGGHGSWQRSAAERKKWHALMARELAGLAPPKPFNKIKVTFTRFSSVQPDYDGLVHGFKPVRDALVKFGFVVDDKNQNMEAVYEWRHAPPKAGHIRVVIRSLEE